MSILSRRRFAGGLLAALAAPAIIRTPGLLMQVKRVLIPDAAGTIVDAAGTPWTMATMMMPGRRIVGTDPNTEAQTRYANIP